MIIKNSYLKNNFIFQNALNLLVLKILPQI